VAVPPTRSRDSTDSTRRGFAVLKCRRTNAIADRPLCEGKRSEEVTNPRAPSSQEEAQLESSQVEDLTTALGELRIVKTNGDSLPPYADLELIGSLFEAQMLIEDWRQEYNHYRPHQSLRYLTPAEFTRRWHAEHPTDTS
jgi:hypothetical protein